jgi:hypothetical protein
LLNVFGRSNSSCRRTLGLALTLALAVVCYLESRVHGAAPMDRVVESTSFRIVGLDSKMASPAIAECCEQMRRELALRWLGEEAKRGWSPKCEVVLHATVDSYLQEVGRGGRNTVASSLVDRDGGRVMRRRIDLLAANARWSVSTLGHELTHLVLADLSAEKNLPRWLDEGIAILADSPTKQVQHRQDLKRALQSGGEFRLLELVSLGDYPSAERWGAFYGQSASLVQYLVEQRGEQQFVAFVQLALADGYDRGLQQVYGCAIPELERRWRAQLSRQAVPFLSRKSAPSAPHSPLRAEIVPVSLEIR